MQAGVKTPKPGDTVTERFVGLGQRGDAPQPPKVFEFHIEPASSVNSLVNGSQPQQPVQPGFQQPPQQQYAPQQPQQARIRGISRLRSTRGTRRRNWRSSPSSRYSSANSSSRRLIR